MDKNSFDDKLREKLSNINPSYDPGLWEDMEDILEFKGSNPWYLRGKSYLWAGAITLLTLFNLYLLSEIRDQKKMVSGLMEEKKDAVFLTDTIYIADTVYLVDKNTNRSSINSSPRNYRPSRPTHYGMTHASLYSSKMASSNFSPIYFSGLINKQIAFDIPLKYSSLSGAGDTAKPGLVQVPRIESPPVDYIQWLMNQAESHNIEKISGQPKIPRRQYQNNPLEIRAGVLAGVLVPDPDIGERYLSNKYGIIAEVSLKRNITFLTGLQYINYTYKLDEVDDNNFNRDDLQRYPGFNELITTPNDIVVNNEMLEIPLQIRLYKSLNYEWSVFLSGGPSFDFLVKQSFNYHYIDIENDQLVDKDVTTYDKNLKVYVSSISGALGIEHKFSRKLSGLVHMDYQYGFGKYGVEKRSVNSLSLNLGAFYKIK